MSGKPEFGIAAIRAAAAKRADATSLRSTAEEIGMSYTAFRHFLKGGDPHPGTREKLVGWYLSHRSGKVPALQKQDMAAAVELLRAFVAAGTTKKVREHRLAQIVASLSSE